MKLKYLLPVATIASVATIVTPLVTSCSGKGATASWSKGEEYKPLDPKEKVTYATQIELATAYHDAIKENKFIYSDDMVYYYYLGSKDQTSNPSVDYEITNVSYTTINVGDVEQENSTNPAPVVPNAFFRITFDVKLSATITIDISGMDGPTSDLVYTNALIHIVDMPIKPDIESGIGASVAGMDMSFLKADTKWTLEMPEVKYDETQYKFSLGENKTYNNTVISSLGPELSMVFDYFCGYLVGCKSNYFSLAEAGWQY